MTKFVNLMFNSTKSVTLKLLNAIELYKHQELLAIKLKKLPSNQKSEQVKLK